MLRRDFIKNTGFSALVTGSSLSTIWDALIRDYKLKTSCNMYSFNQLLTDGSMTLERAIEFCGELGFDAVDPTGYYFTGYPQIPSDGHIYKIKHTAFINGMAISGTGIRNDFALPDKNERERQVDFTRRWIEVAAKLDAPVIRVFAGNRLPEGVKVQEVQKWILDALYPCIDFGKDHGVIITLQNHFDALKTVEEVKFVLDQIDSPWFGLNLDIGSLRDGDPYEQIETLIPYARTWQIKENVYRNGTSEPTDINKLIALIKRGKYKGYIPLETLPPSNPLIRLESFLREVEMAMAF